MTDLTHEEAAAGATALLVRAEQVASEHVAAGEARRAELIAEGETFLRDAQLRSSELVAEAEEATRVAVDQAKHDAAELTTKVEDLRKLEADYRAKLRETLEDGLARLGYDSITG
jgi:uncharacterized membrane protein